MESPTRFDLENINITPLCEGLILQKHVSGLHLIHGSIFTHCVAYPNSIKGSFNKLFYTHTRALSLP